MKWGINSICVPKIYAKTFYCKNDQNGRTVLFLMYLKKNDNDFINMFSNLLTFYFVKPIIFNTEIGV